MHKTHFGPFSVTPAEAGAKLLRFLERRLPHVSKGTLHKWIRTGQVRLNGKRTAPFSLVEADDIIRVPPFAGNTFSLEHDTSTTNTVSASTNTEFPSLFAALQAAGLVPIEQGADYILLNKPAGLPVQDGTGHSDSVASRLRHVYAGHPFMAAPVHRLDKHTTGLLAVGTTQRALVRLSNAFASPGSITKEYHAVIAGHWPYSCPVLLSDRLSKERMHDGRERMVSQQQHIIPLTDCDWEIAATAVTDLLVAATVHRDVRQEKVRASQADSPDMTHSVPGILHVLADTSLAHLVVAPFPACIVQKPPSSLPHEVTCLRIRLLTGKQHQIRAQLAARGFPVVGDTRYLGPAFPRLLLHASLLALEKSRPVSLLPDWMCSADNAGQTATTKA